MVQYFLDILPNTFIPVTTVTADIEYWYFIVRLYGGGICIAIVKPLSAQYIAFLRELFRVLANSRVDIDCVIVVAAVVSSGVAGRDGIISDLRWRNARRGLKMSGGRPAAQLRSGRRPRHTYEHAQAVLQ